MPTVQLCRFCRKNRLCCTLNLSTWHLLRKCHPRTDVPWSVVASDIHAASVANDWSRVAMYIHIRRAYDIQTKRPTLTILHVHTALQSVLLTFSFPNNLMWTLNVLFYSSARHLRMVVLTCFAHKWIKRLETFSGQQIYTEGSSNAGSIRVANIKKTRNLARLI